MKLAVCIASRGHPQDLLAVIKSIDDRMLDPAHTLISVALDDDDDSNPSPPPTKCELRWSIAPREDSLGAKYNRAQMNGIADLYVLGADDNLFVSDGWDETIRKHAEAYGGEPGLVYFGRLDGTLPTQMAIPHSFIKYQGFLFPPYWPFWFHDTWIDEIGHLTSRILWAPIRIQEIGGRGKTRGLRDVIFWAEFFEMLRPAREAIAQQISQDYNPKWLQLEIEQKLEIYRRFFSSRTLQLRDKDTAVTFERRMSTDAPISERYLRIKAKAESAIAEIKQQTEAA